MEDETFTVIWKKKVSKQVRNLPLDVQKAFFLLINDLKKTGAIQPNWRNFSSLGNNKYHCHLKYHWVACWEWQKETIRIEVFYAGSRENAPY